MKLRNEVIKAINGFVTPEKIAGDLIRQICLSEYTLESIRGLIIDPIKSKLVPKEISSNIDDFMYDLYALIFLNPPKVLQLMFNLTKEENVQKILDDYKHKPDEGFWDNIYYGTPFYSEKSGGHTCIITHKGCFIYANIIKDHREGAALSLYFVGPTAFKVHNEFQELKEKAIEWIEVGSKSEDTRRILVASENNRGNWGITGATVPTTIIIDHVQEDLEEILKMIERSENLVEEFNLNKTIGILLHGPHGTGKSTIARYLAMALNRVLILTTAKNLDSAIDYIQSSNYRSSRKYIMLIEDIDFMFTDRRKTQLKKSSSSKKKDDEENEVTQSDDDMNDRTSLLFQILDGVLSNNNLVVVATTNYFDRLDPALIRDGRFDYKIEMHGLDYETASKVCEKFGVSTSEIDLQNWKLPISPATLQTVLLKYKVTNKNTYDPTKLTDHGDEN